VQQQLTYTAAQRHKSAATQFKLRGQMCETQAGAQSASGSALCLNLRPCISAVK